MPKSRQRSNERQHSELSAVTRGEILELHNAGCTYGEISKQLGIKRSTVSTTVYRFQDRKTFDSKKRSGRPPKATKRIRKNIENYVKRHRDAIPKEIVERLQLPVKQRRVYDIRKQLGFIPDKGKKIPKLTDINKEDRLCWCKKHKNDNFEDVFLLMRIPFVIGKGRRLLPETKRGENNKKH